MNQPTAISRYLMRRIDTNARWYAHKNALERDFGIARLHESLFEIVQASVMQSLQNGHTVVAIRHDEQIDEQGVLTAWQWDFLSPVILLINEKLQNPLDFQEIFLAMRAMNADELGNFAKQMMGRYQTLILTDLPQMLTAAREQRKQLLLGVLRLYYAMSSGRLTWQNLPALLQESVFFGELGELLKQQYQTTKQGIIINPPLVYHRQNNALYLWANRAFCAESELMTHIWRIDQASVQSFSTQTLPANMNDAQKLAVKLVANRAFALITGGPGTGKTYTVAQIVLAMSGQQEHLRLALSAPTGKAAQRMSESLQKSLSDNHQIALPEPKTIHRLLGIGGAGRPRYHAGNPLPYDVIIVDEASMLGAELACQLLAAVKTGTRLILIGDAHQLAAVDAGAVLSDLCRMPSLQDNLVRLTESRRFNAHSGVGKLATLVNDPADHDWQAVMDLIDAYPALSMVQIGQDAAFYEQLAKPYQSFFEQTADCRSSFARLPTDEQERMVAGLMNTLNQYRILCASHRGRCGDEQINEYLRRRHREQLRLLPSSTIWYHGLVVMITKNRYDLGLYNGDIGICLQTESGLMVYFEGETLRRVSVDVLDEQVVTTAYAITVHKSQGSEWQQVGIVFDDDNQRLLSKELVYTAITRAKEQVIIFGTKTAFVQAINTPTVRQTGLELMASASASA